MEAVGSEDREGRAFNPRPSHRIFIFFSKRLMA